VDVSSGLDAPYAAEVVFPWVADLGRYPAWLDIVKRVDPDPDVGLGPQGSDSWTVELRARLGPVARSKRLRMVRTVYELNRSVRFERAELDGRDHSSWVLEVSLAPTGAGCRLTMGLHYAGGSLAPLVQRLLTEEIRRSGRRLLDGIAAGLPA
jgi:hypothetical protein